MLACWNKIVKYDTKYGHPDKEECNGYQVKEYKKG